MRTKAWARVLIMAALMPRIGTAQVYVQPSPYPQATAASASWQRTGEPLFHAGAFYYPSGPTIFFDGNVMMRTGSYEEVALYEDATQAPFSVVYVRLGGNRVRPYERRREGGLAGTVGSRTPSFPIQRDGELAMASRRPGIVVKSSTAPEGGEPNVAGEVFSAVAVYKPLVAADLPAPVTAATTRSVQIRDSAPRILSVWISYEGVRWESAGAAVPYSAERFAQSGEHHGFLVYRDRRGGADVIYVSSVAGGPIAPYKRTR